MSKTLKIYLFLFAVLIAIMIVIDQSRQKPPDWSPTYFLDGKKPLDLYVFNQEIGHLFKDSIVRYSKTPFDYFMQRDSIGEERKSYLFINEYVHVDYVLLKKILEAVSQGNTLFVVSHDFDQYLTDTLGVSCNYAPFGNPIVNFNIGGSEEEEIQKSNDDRTGVKLKLSNETWSKESYFYSPVFGQFVFVRADTVSTTALGYMTFPDGSEYINFMEIAFGKGKIILHNQPVVFSNYALLSNEPLQEYTEKVLSYLPDQPVVWFVESQLSARGGMSGRNQLSVIFAYPALRMTWLIFIYGLILFVIFTAKRKQRVVPIIKPLRNTTVEFAQTIGNLYFQEGDIGDIARKKGVYFLDRVRRTYHIDAQLSDEGLVNRLHHKSGKERDLIEEIISLIRNIDGPAKCNSHTLVRLNILIARFWENDSSLAMVKE